MKTKNFSGIIFNSPWSIVNKSIFKESRKYKENANPGPDINCLCVCNRWQGVLDTGLGSGHGQQGCHSQSDTSWNLIKIKVNRIYFINVYFNRCWLNFRIEANWISIFSWISFQGWLLFQHRKLEPNKDKSQQEKRKNLLY